MKRDEMTTYQKSKKEWLFKGKIMLSLSIIFLILAMTRPDGMAIYGLLSYACYALIGKVQGERPER